MNSRSLHLLSLNSAYAGKMVRILDNDGESRDESERGASGTRTEMNSMSLHLLSLNDRYAGKIGKCDL